MAARRRKTILLVEDNDDDVELARAAFARCGVPLELAVVEDGAAALDYLFCRSEHAARPPEPPDLVLLDLKLPGIDGFEVLSRARAAPGLRGLPVVVFTSSVEEQDVARSVECGANSYVRKPTDFDEFVAGARQLAGYWLTLHVSPVQPAERDGIDP